MTRLFISPLAAGFLICIGTQMAAADQQPSALVALAPILRGTLPHIVTVYGNVGSYSSATQTLMAPLQATITDVFVRSGEAVPQGAPLLRLTPSPTSQLAYRQAQDEIALATELAARTQTMVTGHLATEEQLLQAQKDVADARSALAALQAQGANGAHTVKAPFAAIVTSVEAAQGAIVSEGDGLVQLAQPGAVEVEAGVVPSDAMSINAGDPVKLTPIGGGAPFEGKIVFRGAFVDLSDGLVSVDVSVQAGQAMLGEMFRADITAGVVHGYIVPHAAVLIDDLGDNYIVQAHNMTAKQVQVQVLEEANGEDVINGPVDAHAPVILAGNYQLDDGMSIRVDSSKTEASNQ